VAVTRFRLDEDLSQTIALIGRRLGVDVDCVQELPQRGLDDAAQLLLAAEAGRCLVTHNGSDFRRLSTLFYQRSYPHAGVLIVPPSLQGNEYAVIAAALAAYDLEHPDGVVPYLVDYLQPSRR
jgi:hypothetical protein